MFFCCRDFLRLGFPLYSQSLEASDDINDFPSKLDEEDTIIHENKNSEEQNQELPNNESIDKECADESFKKTSDVIVTPRKLSDLVSRKHSDADARPNTLTFRDVMLSMIVPSSESGSDVESNSDEDDYMIVTNDTPGKTSPEQSPAVASETDDDTPPQRPPRRHKTTARKQPFEHNMDSNSICDLNSNPGYQVSLGPSEQRQDLVTAEVDGVDIDTIGNTDQVVSSIDQGEDLVILDVKGETEANNSDGFAELTPERKHSETSVDIVSEDDGNLLRTKTVGMATDTPTTETRKVAGILSTETVSTVESPNIEPEVTSIGIPERDPVNSTTGGLITSSDTTTTDTPHKVADVSCDDMSMRLSMQLAELPLDSDCSSFNQQGVVPLNEEEDNSEAIEKDEDEDDDEEEEISCQVLGGGPVSLTRVKCVVSMTTPRDARAHGVTDCPSFVEFDMSVDGFGCLFLPAIAPQVSAGKIYCELTSSKTINYVTKHFQDSAKRLL